ncbi:MAG: hypothetical protein KUG77_04420 [Nannocystaceae bacterium]|nr:hypothetical protein [Nannocystaceae bacterium]
MRGLKLGMPLALGCMLSGCAQGDDFSDEGQSLRAAGEMIEFWNFRPNDPGNGEVELSDDDSLPDVPTFTIVPSGGGDSDVYDVNNQLVVSTNENQIFDATGTLYCTAYLEDGLYKLRQGLDGAVLLTATQGRYVFWGDVQELPTPGTYAWQHLLHNELAYEFYGDVLYDGPRWFGDDVGSADVHIHRANPMRKLLIGALFEGECGTAQQPLPPPG